MQRLPFVMCIQRGGLFDDTVYFTAREGNLLLICLEMFLVVLIFMSSFDFNYYSKSFINPKVPLVKGATD